MFKRHLEATSFSFYFILGAFSECHTSSFEDEGGSHPSRKNASPKGWQREVEEELSDELISAAGGGKGECRQKKDVNSR